MKIELLNVKIEIQKNSVVTDHHANRKNAWTPFYTCHATVSAEAPKEDSEAGLIIDGSKADFTFSHITNPPFGINEKALPGFGPWFPVPYSPL